MGPQRMFGMTPWVRRLLVANLLVFLLQKTIFVSPRFVESLGFVPLLAFVHPWTFVTYLFVHATLLHLAFNLLALFVFGPPVEERLGSRAFIGYYLLCGLGGAALSYALMLLVPVGLVVGASGAIYGVMLAFAWYWPDQPIYVFPLPEPIPVRWLVTFVVAISLVLPLLGAGDGTAHLAHLGGFAAGFAFLRAREVGVKRAPRGPRAAAEPGVVLQSAARMARSGAPAGGPAKPRAQGPTRDAIHQQEIDRVLDKISASGIDSLTPAERKFLAEMSKKMRGPE